MTHCHKKANGTFITSADLGKNLNAKRRSSQPCGNRLRRFGANSIPESPRLLEPKFYRPEATLDHEFVRPKPSTRSFRELAIGNRPSLTGGEIMARGENVC